jgi:hypothetical protein
VRNKFNATKVHGFASRLEAKVWAALVDTLQPGQSLICQHTITFQSGIRLVLDFAVFDAAGSTQWYEAKGQELPTWRLKLKLLKHEYPTVYEALTVVYGSRGRAKRTARVKALGGWVDVPRTHPTLAKKLKTPP